MALSLYPTFTPSGFLTFATAQFSPSFISPTGIQVTHGSAYTVPTGASLPVGSSPASVLVSNLGPDPAYVAIAAAAATTTGTANAGSTTLTVVSGSGIVSGQVVVGAGIAPGCAVVSISGTTVTLTIATTAPLSTTAVNFLAPITPQTGTVVQGGTAPIGLAYVSSGFIQALCSNPGGRSILNATVGV